MPPFIPFSMIDSGDMQLWTFCHVIKILLSSPAAILNSNPAQWWNIFHRNSASITCFSCCNHMKFIFLRKEHTNLGGIYLGTIVNSRFISNCFPMKENIIQHMMSFKRPHACERDLNIPGNNTDNKFNYYYYYLLLLLIIIAKSKK